MALSPMPVEPIFRPMRAAPRTRGRPPCGENSRDTRYWQPGGVKGQPKTALQSPPASSVAHFLSRSSSPAFLLPASPFSLPPILHSAQGSREQSQAVLHGRTSSGRASCMHRSRFRSLWVGGRSLLQDPTLLDARSASTSPDSSMGTAAPHWPAVLEELFIKMDVPCPH